jgi:hypothetical protein
VPGGKTRNVSEVTERVLNKMGRFLPPATTQANYMEMSVCQASALSADPKNTMQHVLESGGVSTCVLKLVLRLSGNTEQPRK